MEREVEGLNDENQEDVVVNGDVYEEQEDCDVLLEVDVLELLVALPR